MTGEDQERFEDYLELEHFIEELQAGHVVHPPKELTPTQAGIYRMAALFRSAAPEEAEPRPEFAQALKARLEQELQERTQKLPRLPLIPLPKKQKQHSLKARKPHLSRRALLSGSAVAAAGLVAGVAIDKVIENQNTGPHLQAPTDSILPAEVPSTWIAVTTVAEIGDQAIKFVSGNMVGFVIRKDEEGPDTGPGKKGDIIAMSAACTHMGCIVSWNPSDRKYHCPCHGGTFYEYGQTDQDLSSKPLYLRPLPRLDVHVEKDGTVKVRVPMDPQ